jgi:PPE-repeat protein
MLDFGALPPEINSARMYSGPGSAPMMAAASAWDAVAAQLESYAAGYSSTLSALRGLWYGGASFTMAAAVAPYIAWATATAGQAEQTASQARAAAAAFEAAFAATVPPPVVAANRIQLAMLVATNFFGQNTPAIAATEAQYAEMWAQDAATMYGYAASSSAATALTRFIQPPRTTNVAGPSAQAAAATHATSDSTGQTQTTLAELMSALPHQLPTLATGTSTNASAADPSSLSSLPSLLSSTSPLLAAVNDFNTLTGPANLAAAFSRTTSSAARGGTGAYRLDIQSSPAGLPPALIRPTTSAATTLRGRVIATVGEAAPVGDLSVPQGWLTTAAVPDPINGPIPLPDTAVHAAPAAANAHPGTNMLGGMPKGESEPTGSFVLRNGRRRFQMPRPPYGG